MTDYFDYRGANSGRFEAGPSSFVRPLNLSDRKSGSTNTSYNSRASNATGVTYATDGSAPLREGSQQSPAEPIRGMPTPVMQSKPLRLPGEEQYDDDEEEEDDSDPEYMMVDADLSMVSQFGAQNQPPSAPGFQEPPLKVMNNKPVPVKVQGGHKGFVGGFVSGLRRLPRLLRNQRGQSVQRQPSHDTVLELPGFGEDSPGYDPFRAHPPSILRPAQPASNLRHPQPIPHTPSIPASHQVTSMHYSHYTQDEQSEPSEHSESPISRDPRDFDSDELEHGHDRSGSEQEGDQHSAHKQSTAAHSTHRSTHHSTQHSTQHSTHRSTHHSTHHSNHHSSSRKSNHHSDHASPHHSTTPSRPQTALDGDTTLIHQPQNGEPEAVVVQPLPTSDYKSMAPESPSSSSSSAAANSNRLQRFVTDVYNLPWVGTHVTVDFVPERDGRKFRGMDPDEKKSPKLPQSWYPSLHHDLNLLEGESPSRAAPVMAHRRQDGHRRALTESTVTPTSAGVTQSVTPSTGYSPRRYSVNSEPIPRHQRPSRDFRHPSHRHRRRHRDHSRPHSPPIYPVIASPQPLYLYPGPASPHVMPVPQPVLGSSASSYRSKRGITSPAVPVYMIPMPAPVYQPMSGFHYAPPQPTNSQPAQSQPTQPQSAQSQSAQSQPATNPPTSA